MRVGVCIADSDTSALLVPLVYSDIIGDGLPQRLAAGTSCLEGREGRMSDIDRMLRGGLSGE